MQTYRLSLQPLTAFGTPLVGDTLFGQLCWTLRHLHGEARLERLLENYTNNQPFAVVSDAFPTGFLPLPTIPPSTWQRDESKEADRKALKKKRWVSVDKCAEPLATWQQHAQDDDFVGQVSTRQVGLKPDLRNDAADKKIVWQTQEMQPHNTLDRKTNTTGTGQFSPYQLPQTWFHPEMRFDLYIVLDESRLSLDELNAALDYIGNTGYGRDASTGLGKFTLLGKPEKMLQPTAAQHWLTLAPCAPQGCGLVAARSFYQVQTRFGRHGDIVARGANPFKHPLLMARTAAVFGSEDSTPRQFIGQGIANVSNADARTVHQGYAPVLPLRHEVKK